MTARGPKRFTGEVFCCTYYKGSYLLHPQFFISLQFIKVKIEGVSKCLMIFLFTFVTFFQDLAIHSRGIPRDTDDSCRASKNFGNRKLQKTWLVTLFGPLAAILNFTQKCKQTAVSQKLSKIKNFFKIFFASHEVPKLLRQ